ncbi:sn-glycerol-3-phosphate ABC transporter ATP-binding protein UgpC [Methylocaldum sp.]|uniref:ABC transporter ATP-binding protein n=1 Tax=Methylocaldum sp. TaxID=1969727 RepID=UPI002D4E27D0|nr:sn-glycerol-3-phosphate ABC transporter ATP-binding protein UgpC [Methylocaldum sp.]HYE35899.1 sn-glycerol-3-phosphate ABC transporter ATP-binding protein UgpC [Methylocaldum sp.]
MAEIVLDHVSKRFAGGAWAVRKANFTIRDGEFFIFVGPSGCGKSTLLHMIVGLEDITEGEIRIDGKRINELDPRDRNMAMVFQSYALYPHMTVRENIAFPLKLAKLARDEIKRRVDEAAAILELDPLLDRRPSDLSGGQRQRVAMGRAIVRRPQVFLLDEPLSNLDARLRVQMRTEIAALQERLGITTIYVTHDQTEAMVLGDRVAILRKGEVQQIGTPKELYEVPHNEFVAGFIGSPSMNFLHAEISDARLLLPIGPCPLPPSFPLDRLSNRSVVAGIRPEHFFLPGSSHRVGPAFRAEIALVEWLGADLYLHVRPTLSPLALRDESSIIEPETQRAGITLIARVPPDLRLQRGDRIELAYDASKVQLFDADTGESFLRNH